MTSTISPPQHTTGDDPAAVLAYAREQKQIEEDAAREVMKAAAQWAAMHSAHSLVGPLDSWHVTALPLGGEGCPEIAEFAVIEFATALGWSTERGRRYLTQTIEARYRLERCWKQLAAGRLQAWKLGTIAEETICLSPKAAEFVDRHVAPVAHKVGHAQLRRLIAEAKALFDPDQVEADRLAAAETRHVDVRLGDVTIAGTVHIDAELDLADALDLDAALAAGAEQQRLLGSTDSLDVRRAIALGDLARGQTALDLPTEGPKPWTKRQVVLHVHLSEASLRGAGGLGRVEEARGPITTEQIREWCGNPDTTVTVRPVIDLAEHIHVDAYEIPDRLKAQIDLRDHTCAFPRCTRPARRCDHDHRVPHEDGGATCSCNIAPLCRRHHRAKTTGGWTYTSPEPGTYLWHSPFGSLYLRDHTGTTDITPDVTPDDPEP
jgi:hypothetical protein